MRPSSSSVCGFFFKLAQVALDLPVQPFQLAVCLRMPYPCKYVVYVQLHKPFLKSGHILLFCFGFWDIELGTAISQYRCRLSMIFDGLLQYCKGVLCSGMIKDAVSGNEV